MPDAVTNCWTFSSVSWRTHSVIELIVSSGLLHFIYHTRISHVLKGRRPHDLGGQGACLSRPIQHFSQCLLGFGVAYLTKWGLASSCCSHISRLMRTEISNDSDSLFYQTFTANFSEKPACLLCAWATTSDQTCESRVLVIWSLLNPTPPVNIIFLWSFSFHRIQQKKKNACNICCRSCRIHSVWKFVPTCSWRTPTRTSIGHLWWDCAPLSRVGLMSPSKPKLFLSDRSRLVLENIIFYVAYFSKFADIVLCVGKPPLIFLACYLC